MARKTCNRKHFAKRLAAGRRACNRVEKGLQPLCRHLLSLAQDDMRSGTGYRCTRAGREISQAIKLADKYPR
jgi:hypothetical protein